MYPRGAPFAAVIPGDGVAEQVFTTGIQSFLCGPLACAGKPLLLVMASGESVRRHCCSYMWQFAVFI